MNHLEQLVAEWLQFNGYFVRSSVLVGRRANGGFEGELDVVGIHLGNNRLLHVECSLDANSTREREHRFSAKFDRGRKFIKDVFQGMPVDFDSLESVVVMGAASRAIEVIGGGRVVTVRELVLEIFAGLQGTTPLKGAVPSNFPLLRTLQLASYAMTLPSGASVRKLIETREIT